VPNNPTAQFAFPNKAGSSASMQVKQRTPSGFNEKNELRQFTGADALTIEQAAAASWNLPSGADYSLRHLSGR
jgi:hypothetical protein